MNYIEFLHNRDKYLGENHDDFLMHYGILGQKWGQRHWQNPDGTYTTEGKIRYFGSKKAQAEMNADETKIGSKTSDAKDYLKFRNKMLKERTRPDLNEWYRDKNKYLDKQLVRDAKRVDKQQEKMYKNQLKDWYDNPEDLVTDLNAMYKIGGKAGKEQKISSWLSDADNAIAAYNTVQNKMKNDSINEIAKEFTEDNNTEDITTIIDNNERIAKKMIGTLKKGNMKKYMKFRNKIDDDFEKDVIEEYANKMRDKEENHLAEYYIDSAFGNDQKIGGLFSKKTPEEKAEKKAQKEADKLNDFLDEEYETDRRHWSEVMGSFIDSDSEYYPLFKQINENNDKILAKDYEKVEKIFDDYNNNDDEYVVRAAITNALINDPDATLGDIGWMSRFYLMDDGDQGYANSANLYARYEKNIDMKELQNLYKNINYNDKLKDDNIKYLKDNNPVLSKIKEKYLYEMLDENDDKHFWDKSDKLQSSLGALYNATDGSVENGNLERNTYEDSKKITNKLQKSCSTNNGWDYLNEAIENLNLSSVQINNLSSSDWDKINAEIERLKK